jgi:protocatechuate 3,4-dioxygenase beta subunit
MKTLFLVVFFVAAARAAQSQLVQIGPPDMHFCDKLKVSPNLTVDRNAIVSGHLIDGSGAPFRNSTVELRAFISETKQTRVRAVSTDADGYFRLDTVKKGKYRLVASPTRAFQQPVNLRCVNEHCELRITLATSPTDVLGYNCPVR